MPKGVYLRTEEHNKNLSLSHTGYKQTKEHKEKYKNRPTNKGKHWKVKDTSKYGHKKEEHPNWKGGISKDVHSICEPKYKKWRSDVFQRDNWTCQTCGIRGIHMEAHHINSWAKFENLRYILDNGVTLCKECHQLTNNYRGKRNG